MTIDVAKLAKVLALVDSPSQGEATAATARVTAILKAAGKSWRDLPAILGTTQTAPQQATAWAAKSPVHDFGDFFADVMEEHEPGYKAARAAEDRRKAKEQAKFRAELVARYGSEKAALASTPMERAVDEAVAQFVREEMIDYANGRFETTTLDGWHGLGDPPEHVAEAARAALPLPKTITEAKAEYDAWQERNRELQALYGDSIGNTHLSCGCSLRERIIYGMLDHGLRANGAEDALIRFRFIADSGSYPNEKEMDAMLADLEHLAETQARGAQNGQRDTASDRRAVIERMLSTLDNAQLADREIARRVGVSPQTVGNIRRRMKRH